MGCIMKRSWIVSGICAALVVGGVAVKAQLVGNPGTILPDHSVPEQIPYRGYIERNGVPYNSPNGTPFSVRFAIYSAATSGTLLWQETHGDVIATEGNFAAALGSVTAFTQLACSPSCNGSTPAETLLNQRPLFQYPSLFLEIAVQFPGESTFTTLSNRQRILSSPYAMTARQAEMMNVSRDLQVAGATTLTSVTASSIASTGTLSVTGTSSLTGNVTASGNVTLPSGTMSTWNGRVNNTLNAGRYEGLTASSPVELQSGAEVNGVLNVYECCLVQCVDIDTGSPTTYVVASTRMTTSSRNSISTTGNGDPGNDRYGFAYVCSSPYCSAPYTNSGGTPVTLAAGAGPCW